MTTTRAHRAEAVEALALEPLHVLLLQVARADVVDDGVAEDVVERVGAAGCCARHADDDAELHFPVHLLRDRAVTEDVVERADDGGRRLGEEHRHVRDLRLLSRAPSRFLHVAA